MTCVKTRVGAFVDVLTFESISIITLITKTFVRAFVIDTSSVSVTSVLHGITVIDINAMFSMFDITFEAKTCITTRIVNAFHMLATMMCSGLALVNVIATHTITSEPIKTFTRK